MPACGGVQNVSRPMRRCHATSQVKPAHPSAIPNRPMSSGATSMARAAENAERRSASVAIETDFKGGCACARQRFYSGAVSALVTTDIAVAPERSAAGHRLARRASWTLFAIAGVLALGSLVIVVTHLSAATRDDGYVRGFGAVLALGYAAIGSRVATRHP